MKSARREVDQRSYWNLREFRNYIIIGQLSNALGNMYCQKGRLWCSAGRGGCTHMGWSPLFIPITRSLLTNQAQSTYEDISPELSPSRPVRPSLGKIGGPDLHLWAALSFGP